MSRTLIAGAVLGAGLISGGLLIQSGAWSEAAAVPASARLLDDVMARVRQDYVDSIPMDELYVKTATGFVKELEDPHSALLTPDQVRSMDDLSSGHYAGIGVELDLRDGFVTVIAPLAGSPADSAGVRAGDHVLAIGKASTIGMSMDVVQEALRGAPGSSVTLTLDSGGSDERQVTIVRRDIALHAVQLADLAAPGVGRVVLASFNEHAADEVRAAVESLRARGARALVLDMRANPGGLLEQGVAVADLFLDARATIVRTRGRTPDTRHQFDDAAVQPWPGMPIVVLVDSGTASAAEIVAGALQDNDRATIVGTPTYGKGSAQAMFPLTDGRALKLTTARWFTPDGRTIARDSTKGGITPDVLVAAEVDTAAAAGKGPARDAALARSVEIVTPKMRKSSQ